MVELTRVLDQAPVAGLSAYEDIGGGAALRWAQATPAAHVIAAVEMSGLRGRGGGGFPTGTKWRTVRESASELPMTVVVNAAEGEPGSFKDRAILRTNPYRVLEGALVAAEAVGADTVVVAIKQRFRREAERVRGAATEIQRAGWSRVAVDVVEGPDEYLFGEETALLEVIEGRLPFPRLAPPWRQGLDSQPEGSASSAEAVLAASDDGLQPPPALVNNVETFAHVALIGQHGPDWFRSVGLPTCPGTIVCTLSGATGVTGVVEVPTGTTLREVVDAVGGDDATEALYALPGVANPILPAAHFDLPLGYDELRDAGSGLGTAGFILFDERVDPVSVALGVARFLGVESCGQCTPCKQDGLAIAESLTRVQVGEATLDAELPQLNDRLSTITDGARCYLATQHHDVVSSLLRLLDPGVRQARPGDPAPYPIVEIIDLVEEDDGAIVHLDEGHLKKQPDWSYDEEDSGQAPAERFDQDLALP